MYFNDVHILIYVAAAVLGLLSGKIADIASGKMITKQKFFSRDFWKPAIQYKPNYFLPIINAIINIVIVYTFGIGKTFLTNLNLIKYAILTPLLLCVFLIDYREQIIPNRLNLTIFEIGVILLFAAGIFNVNIAIDKILGMVVGGGIFLLITLIGGLIAGKEAMGFGDVKLMTGLGLFFGFTNIIMVTLVAFLLGAVISIILLATKVKKTSEYIPFGPFIVIGCFIVMVVPFSTLLSLLVTIFSLGMIHI